MANDVATDSVAAASLCNNSQFVMTHDNQYVLYRSGSDATGYALKRVDTDGSNATTLIDPEGSGTVDSFRVSDDSSYVVVEGNVRDEDDYALFSVPITGGTPKKISN